MAYIFTYGPFVLDDLTTLHRHEFDAVYDGPTYLYHEHLLHFSGVLAPESVSYGPGVATANSDGARSPQPSRAPGHIGADTVASIQHALMQPQQRLLVQVTDSASPGGRFTAFRAPLGGLKTDADNGPFPLQVRVTEAVGSTTLFVEMVIRVRQNQCQGSSASSTPPIVLSHRWTPSHSIDENLLTTVTVRGHATLRSDARLAFNRPASPGGAIPDDFRQAFFHDIAPFCQRENIWVEADEGGNALRYSFSDMERMENVARAAQAICPGLLDVEASHSCDRGSPGMDDMIVAVGNGVVGGMDRLARAASGTIGLPAAVGFAAVGTALDIGLRVVQLVPRQIHTVVAQVRGDRTAKRKDLERIALRFCRARINATDVWRTTPATHLSVTFHWERHLKVVTVTLRVKQGVAARVLESAFGALESGIGGLADAVARATVAGLIPEGAPVGAGAAGGGVAGLGAGGLLAVLASATALAGGPGIFAFDRNIMPDGEIPIDILSRDRLDANPAPPNSRGTRGTLLEMLVAQVLQEPCGVPVTPVTVHRNHRQGGQVRVNSGSSVDRRNRDSFPGAF